MEAQDVVRALKNVQKKDLSIIELARQLVGPDGRLDKDKAVFLGKEVADACQEAEAYSQATRRVVWSLKRLLT